MRSLGGPSASKEANRPPVGARAPVDPVARLQDSLGNQGTLRMLHALRRASGREDANEREAARVADTAATGGVASPTPGTAPASRPAASSGQPLGSETRATAEARLGHDFSDVRVHADGAAAASARTIGARAYAVGPDVVFAPGQYSGRADRLLLHELAHTVQDPAGHTVHRNDEDEMDAGVGGMDAGAGGGTPYSTGGGGGPDAGLPGGLGDGMGSGPGEHGGPPPPPAFDPCGVDVPSLSNAELLQMFHRADAYVGDPDHYRRLQFYDYLTLRRRTTSERERRARAGEGWLADNITEVPGMLYRFEPGPQGSVIIVGESGSAAAGAPRSIADGSVVTEHQMRGYLSENHVDEGTLEQVMTDPETPHLVDVATAQWLWAMQHPEPPLTSLLMAPGMGGTFGTWGSGRTPSALTMAVHQGFGVGVEMGFNTPQQYQGLIGEYGGDVLNPLGPGTVDPNLTTGGTARDYDRVRLQQATELMEMIRLLRSVKTTRGGALSERTDTGLNPTYQDAVEAVLGHPSYPYEASQWRGRLTAMGAEAGVSLGPWVAINGSTILINADHVAEARPVLAAWAKEQPDFLVDAYRAIIWGRDIQHDGARYTVPDFNRDLRAGNVPEQVRTQVGEQISQMLVGGVTTEQVRGGTALVEQGMAGGLSARESAAAIRPMQLEGALGGFSPGGRAAGYGALGNVIGGLTVIAIHGVEAGFTGEYPGDLGQDLGNIALTTPLAAGTSSLEFAAEDRLLQQLARSGPGALGGGLGRAGLRLGGAAVAAPLGTALTMGVRGGYGWQEYGVQGIRSGASGVLAETAMLGYGAAVTAFSAGGAEVGAGGGTVVEPGGGTVVGGLGGLAVGAIVGTVAYLIADWVVGDFVESIARGFIGEPDGCGGGGHPEEE